MKTYICKQCKKAFQKWPCCKAVYCSLSCRNAGYTKYKTNEEKRLANNARHRKRWKKEKALNTKAYRKRRQQIKDWYKKNKKYANFLCRAWEKRNRDKVRATARKSWGKRKNDPKFKEKNRQRAERWYKKNGKYWRQSLKPSVVRLYILRHSKIYTSASQIPDSVVEATRPLILVRREIRKRGATSEVFK